MTGSSKMQEPVEDSIEFGMDLQFVRLSEDRKTVWVDALDGSTVGRFSTVFGMDVHRSATDMLEGKGQCLHCTHSKPTQDDWLQFCELMVKHHGIQVDSTLITI